ncbi:hypothetical protein AH4AK4_1714 [Aeromonas hydrophila 4AK4]|nr:hypothetical protein AH4AK4_1714 [Aeromonas hydrophila 4AK4]
MLIFETAIWRQHRLAPLFDQVTRAPCNSCCGTGVKHAEF